MEGRDQVRVLLVEDDEDDFILVRDLLGEQDRTRCEVDWANDPARALSLIRGARHDVYLIAQPLDADRAEDLLASWDPTRFAAAALN